MNAGKSEFININMMVELLYYNFANFSTGGNLTSVQGISGTLDEPTCKSTIILI